ncbi:unnamed protein product, partial [Phaeothamnion confervicola]
DAWCLATVTARLDGGCYAVRYADGTVAAKLHFAFLRKLPSAGVDDGAGGAKDASGGDAAKTTSGGNGGSGGTETAEKKEEARPPSATGSASRKRPAGPITRDVSTRLLERKQYTVLDMVLVRLPGERVWKAGQVFESEEDGTYSVRFADGSEAAAIKGAHLRELEVDLAADDDDEVSENTASSSGNESNGNGRNGGGGVGTGAGAGGAVTAGRKGSAGDGGGAAAAEGDKAAADGGEVDNGDEGAERKKKRVRQKRLVKGDMVLARKKNSV